MNAMRPKTYHVSCLLQDLPSGFLLTINTARYHTDTVIYNNFVYLVDTKRFISQILIISNSLINFQHVNIIQSYPIFFGFRTRGGGT